MISLARPLADLVCVRECTFSLDSQGQPQVSEKQVFQVSRHSNDPVLRSGERQRLYLLVLILETHALLLLTNSSRNFCRKLGLDASQIWPDIIYYCH